MFNTNFTSNIFSQYFTDEVFGLNELTANEKKLTTSFAAKRLHDFSTGRYCAHRALAAIGYPHAEILTGADNQPVWPEGAVGSISHSGKLTGAIVGLRPHFLSIGIDIETTGKIKPDVWRLIYTPTEQDFLNKFTGEELAFYTTLLFSFKESFYKMQHPLTHTFLEFTDVEVFFNGNIFELTILKDFDAKKALPQTVPLHYHQHNNQVITFCYLGNK